MMKDLELEALIEDYLNGKLSPEERMHFEQLRNTDATLDSKVVSHRAFMDAMKYYAELSVLKQKMNASHQKIEVATLTEKFRPHPVLIVQLWRKNKSIFAIAASFILVGLLSIYSLKQSSLQTNSYERMSKEMNSLKNSQSNLIRNVSQNRNTKGANHVKFGGTSFLLSSNGYLLTSYHVVEKSDSVYVQNKNGDSYKVKIVYTDADHDIAVLKITDSKFKILKSIPYSIKKGTLSLGEAVYTIGYPKDDVVYGEGYVSSKSGFNSDTTEYQVAIVVNPGNSGGPLLDRSGNIVGVVNAKESNTDGAAFARKSKYIVEAINSIPSDSLGKRVIIANANQLKGSVISKKIEKIQDFVFMVKVYN